MRPLGQKVEYYRVLPLKSRYMDTWTSISKIRTAKAEFCGSKMSSALKEPRNSALAVLILEIDVHVSIYLLLSERTLEMNILFRIFRPTYTIVTCFFLVQPQSLPECQCFSYETNFTLEMTVIGQRDSAQNEIALSEIVIKMHTEIANESVIEIQGPEMDMKEKVRFFQKKIIFS